MHARAVARFALALFAACFALASAARAATVVLDYDEGATSDFQTDPYLEKATTTTVVSGHYEVIADAGGDDGDLAFNVDEQNLGLSQITITAHAGAPFDVVSFEVVNPAEAIGEISISAVGGGGGAISGPTVAGPYAFGPGFAGIDALVITQNEPGSFSYDDLTLNVLPEPAALPALLASTLALAALRRRRGA